MMEKARARVRLPMLLVDDDEVFRQRLARALYDRGWEVFTAANATEAVAMANEHEPIRAVVDLRMENESGLETLKLLKGVLPDLEVIMLTGYGSIATATDAIKLGAKDYLTKPADADQVLAAFDKPDEADTEQSVERAPSLARVEWEHIQRVLNDCNGNISQAARALGIHRRSLQRKLAKFPPPE